MIASRLARREPGKWPATPWPQHFLSSRDKAVSWAMKSRSTPAPPLRTNARART